MHDRNLPFLKTALIAAIGSVLHTSLASAHPGHGQTPPESSVHYLIEPGHAAPAILLLMLAGLAALYVQVRRQKKPQTVKARRNDR